MHPTLKEEIFKQRVRLIHRGLIKNKRLSEQSTLYSTFVQPFTDVLDSVQLASQDILNSVSLIWTTFWTLSPEKLEQANSDYLQRKGNIAEKWKPIVERSQDALARGDAGLILFMANPSLFLATESLGQALEGGKSVASYLRDTGIKIPLISTVLGSGVLDDLEASVERSASIASTPTKDKSFIEKLAGLFYIESAWIKGDLILEDVDPQPSNKNVNPEKELNAYLKSTGVLQQVNKSAEEFEKTTRNYLDEITKSEAAPKIAMMKNLLSSKDMDGFLLAVEEAKRLGADIQIKSGDLEKEINDSASKLASSDDFEVTMKKMPEYASLIKEEDSNDKENPSAPSFTDAEKLKAAKKIVFINQKKNMDEQMSSGIEKIKQEIIDIIEKEEPEAKLKPLLSKSKQGISFIKVYDDAKQFILNL